MSWSQTYSGKAFDLIYPDADDVCAADLAHHLGLQCRYGGATRNHWSTAQHSIIVAAAVWARTKDPIATGHGLLHDGHEAYTGDQIHPLKMTLAECCPAGRDTLRELARGIDYAIFRWAGIGNPDAATSMLIKSLDQGPVLALERSLQLGPPPKAWLIDDAKIEPLTAKDLGVPPDGEVWAALCKSWPAEVAEAAFLWAMRRVLPIEIPGVIETPPWLASALKRCLPTSSARA